MKDHSISGSTATLLNTFSAPNPGFTDEAWLKWIGLKVPLEALKTRAFSLGNKTWGLNAPHRARLVRSSRTFTAYRFAGGTNGTTIGSQTIPMSSTVYPGLAVTSHAAGTHCTAELDNVTATS
jgi:hypothetical protein